MNLRITEAKVMFCVMYDVQIDRYTVNEADDSSSMDQFTYVVEEVEQAKRPTQCLIHNLPSVSVSTTLNMEYNIIYSVSYKYAILSFFVSSNRHAFL